MKNLLFQIIDPFTEQEVEEELAKKGLQDIYIIEETGKKLIGGRSQKAIKSAKVLVIDEKLSVDWEHQWALFAGNFKEGKAHIDFTPFGVQKTLFLSPGAGFGDLSHPTTHLMLQMMAGNMEKALVVDIGTGSGILSLGAILMGASYSIGIDIDAKALLHAKKNAKLNQLESFVKFSKIFPKKQCSKKTENIFLMNMILPEQKLFKPHQYNLHAKMWIVSGILQSQRKEYLKLVDSWGFVPLEEHTREGWMGWVFYSV